MLKRIVSVLLVLSIMVLACACSGGTGESSSVPQQEDDTAQQGVNPLTGLPGLSDEVMATRPVAVMINNIRNAVPQDGLSDADLIYEAETEGGITRLLAVYKDWSNLSQIGPVRSAREYYLDFAMPLDAIFVHIGKSVTASEKMQSIGIDNLDGNFLSGYFFTDRTLAAQRGGQEHATFITGEELKKLIADKIEDTSTDKQDPVFNFSEYKVVPGDVAAGTISVRFSGYLTGTFQYQPKTGTYTRSAFGTTLSDRANGETLAVDNVLILYATGSQHPTYPILKTFTLDSGTGYYASRGMAQPITWTKGGTDEPFKLYDTSGEELQINTGKTWICVVDKDYQNGTTFSE